MNLVIVESPAKSKTIEKFLGNNYKVVSSVGHIRDLATTGKFGLGVDVEHDFEPTYIPMPGKKKVISDLKKLVKDADKIYLATDPDREGEAISWHLFDTLGIKENKYDRVLFYEITKEKVLEGLANPRKIDFNLVKSQETRRILDRIIGFRLSKLMQNKTGGKSAGRVQSVALKLVVDREREILAFVKEPYYKINAIFHDYNDMDSELYAFNNKDLEIKDKEKADEILKSLSNEFNLIKIDKKNKNRSSKFPFTTSTLQQEASTKLGFNAKKTMSLAQKLYEGINIGSEHTGLITYMRTDSIRLSDEFTKPTFGYIKEIYGEEYIGYVKKSKKTENVQDAHEGIRPTSIRRTPEVLKNYLTPDELKLYSLIYYRTLASLMADAKTLVTTVYLDNNNYQFKSSGTVITFDGYLKVYSKYEDANDTILPDLSNVKSLNTDDIKVSEHFTKPKSRYTEAKLIQELESLGIGRPSTYATIMSTIREREYVGVEDKKFYPTEIGFTVTDKLQEFFSNIINVKYTANMELELDEIADGKLDNLKVLHAFYDIFEKTLHEAFTKMERVGPSKTGELCPKCGSDLVVRKGKYGEFVACSNYPDCTYVKKEEKEVEEQKTTGEKCPNCGNDLVIKKGRYGEFVACSNYPECKYIKKEEKEEKSLEVIMKCPKCDGDIVTKTTRKGKTFYGCNHFPKCKVALWDKPIPTPCPKCGGIMVLKEDGTYCNECNYKLED
ncbi:MAG: type I DNA topoisomerase [Bacilli bacterium]|nr:type I DNA topoisomerase [Bacilli bacterium]